jgi:hypothetical protein
MEYPRLWVWAIIVGIIIATKLVLRWQATKQTVNDASDRYISDNEKKDSTLDSLDTNTSTKARNIKSYKYGPFRLYRGGFDTWKKRLRTTTKDRRYCLRYCLSCQAGNNRVLTYIDLCSNIYH